jgi:hypothetical protein
MVETAQKNISNVLLTVILRKQRFITVLMRNKSVNWPELRNFIGDIL